MSTPHFPGWYPDPDQSGRERLWDGQAWTHHLREAASSGRFKPRPIALATGSGLLGLLLLVGLVALGTDRNPSDAVLQAPASSPYMQPTSARSTPPPKRARVPAVEGLGLAKAKRKLRAAGLETGDVDRRPSIKRRGTVLKQGVDRGHEVGARFQHRARRRGAAPSGALGSWQAGSFGYQESQGCWLQGQEGNADQDHRQGRCGTYSVTRQRDTGKAEVGRPDRDFQRATSPRPRHRRESQLHAGLLSMPLPRVGL